MDLQKKISPNFRLWEVVRSDTAERMGIDNTQGLTDAVMASVESTAIHILEPVRRWRKTGFTPNSWYRCEQLEYVICARSFFKRLFEKGIVEEKDLEQRYPLLRHLPDELHVYWNEYFQRKQHPKGQAVDFELPTVANPDLFDWCRDNLQYDQLILEFWRKDKGPNSGWVHGSYNNTGPNRGQLLRY
jgi:hypothetical protein